MIRVLCLALCSALTIHGLPVPKPILPAAPQTQDGRTLRPQQASTSPMPSGERRVALVIGNSAYKSSPLRNPVTDARSIAAALQECGFSVTKLENTTRIEMRAAIRNFGAGIAQGGVGLFYYAGHGIQVKGRNFLVPVDADISSEDEVSGEAVEIDAVLAKMESARNRLNILILDACRNDPFSRAFRSSTQGLAPLDAPTGTYIAFATAPGRTAADGSGSHGLYTEQLLKAMHAPGLKIEDTFKVVLRGVRLASKDQQIPWTSSSVDGDFFFVPPTPGQGLATPAPASPTQSSLMAPPLVSAPVGGLQVIANAPDAKVSVDGMSRGYSGPAQVLNIPDLPVGESMVRVEAAGFEPYEQACSIQQGQWTQLRVVLKMASSASPGNGSTAGLSLPGFGLEKEMTLKLGSTSLVMMSIPAGHFRMGSETGNRNEAPPHDVNIPRSFWMGKFPVTQGQFQAVMERNPSGCKEAGLEAPVEKVTATDCQLFLERLNVKQSNWTFRLPSEAEWEYACRAGTTTDRYGDLDAIAWYWDNSSRSTHPTGQKKPNAFGLHDMLGNVWQWCGDLQHDNYIGAPSDGEAWVSNSYFLLYSTRYTSGSGYFKPVHATRGGSWRSDAQTIHSSQRTMFVGSTRQDDLGFRIVAEERRH